MLNSKIAEIALDTRRNEDCPAGVLACYAEDTTANSDNVDRVIYAILLMLWGLLQEFQP